MIYEFADCELDLDRFELKRGGRRQTLEPQVVDVLAYLVKNRGRLVTKAELFDNVWGDRFVSESALTSRIKTARKAVGDDGRAQAVIRTVHGRGYEFVAPVRPRSGAEVLDGGEDVIAFQDVGQLSVHYVPVRTGSRVAVGAVGDGPPFVVLPAYMSNIETIAAGKDVMRSALVAGLARGRRVVMYDRPGTGLTGGDTGAMTLEAAVDEVEDVLSEAGVASAPLLAMSAAGPIGLALAARRPDLVSHLVLVGTFACGPEAYPRRDVQAAVVEMIRAHWGMGSRLIADLWMPDASPQVLGALAESQRESGTPDVAAEYLDAMYAYDASDALDVLDQPALVMHYRDDRAAPFEAGRKLAAGLRGGAELVVLDGRYHVPAPGDVETVLARIEAFVER